MKYLALICLLSGCSLIKINEAAPLPKTRPQFIGVTQVVDDHEIRVRVRVLDISQYWERDGKCTIEVSHELINTTSECGEIDETLNR